MPWDWHAELFRVSRDRGLVPFSTPFDVTAVDFLETLEPELYKVASIEITDLPLIEYIARTGKPIVMSTGASVLEEIDEAVHCALSSGCKDLTLLLCTSSYPADPQDIHLARMSLLRERYGLPVGLSDHSIGLGVSIAASLMSAAMIERHVTPSRSLGGPDASFSLEPQELGQLVDEIRSARVSIGSPVWELLDAETESRRLRRSLRVTEDCETGAVVTELNVRSVRPSGGLDPKHHTAILGRRFSRPMAKGAPVTWNDLE